MILLTGASGHIGKRMSQRFLRDGIDFIGIDYVVNPELLEYRFKKLDVRDTSIADLIEKNGVDSIIHLAFCTNPKMDAKTRDDIDLNGSKNILECAVKKGVKNIVFASSGRVYGDQKREGGFKDVDGNYLNPGEDDYAQNKIKVENIFLKAAKEHELKVAILRFAIVCWQGGGAGMGDMFKSTSKTGRFFTLGDKNPPMQLVHVDDVIDDCLNAIGKEGIFDIASEGTMSLVEIFLEAAKLGGKKPSPIKLPEKLTLGAVRLCWKLGVCPVPPLYLKMLGYDITRDLSNTISTLGKPKHTIQQILKGIVEG
jgi:UDP-glucose 4-epimerase